MSILDPTNISFNQAVTMLGKHFPLRVMIPLRDGMLMPRTAVKVEGAGGKAMATLWGTKTFIVIVGTDMITYYCQENALSWDIER